MADREHAQYGLGYSARGEAAASRYRFLRDQWDANNGSLKLALRPTKRLAEKKRELENAYLLMREYNFVLDDGRSENV